MLWFFHWLWLYNNCLSSNEKCQLKVLFSKSMFPQLYYFFSFLFHTPNLFHVTSVEEIMFLILVSEMADHSSLNVNVYVTPPYKILNNFFSKNEKNYCEF